MELEKLPGPAVLAGSRNSSAAGHCLSLVRPPLRAGVLQSATVHARTRALPLGAPDRWRRDLRFAPSSWCAAHSRAHCGDFCRGKGNRHGTDWNRMHLLDPGRTYRQTALRLTVLCAASAWTHSSSPHMAMAAVPKIDQNLGGCILIFFL